jgi:hypothetical protein
VTKVLRIGTALLAVALATGTSACGSSPEPATTGLTTLWTVNQTSGPGASNTWFTGGMMVRGTESGLTALSLRTGHPEWSWNSPAPPSGDYTSVALNEATADGIGLVTFSYVSQSDNNDTNVPAYESGIDLASGRALWTHAVAASPNVEAPGYQLGDGIIAELEKNGNPNTTVAYVAASDLATGKPAWSTEPDPELRGCDFSGLAISGALVYGVATCSGAFVLYGMSARTGAVESKVTLTDPDCADRPTLWAASGYLLVGCSEPKFTPKNPLVVLRPGSSHQTAVAYSSGTPSLEYPEDTIQTAPFILTGTTLYVDASDSKEDSAIDAVDLASGRELWQRIDPGGMVGADRSGVLIAIKNGGLASSAPVSVSLAVMSAQSGAINYGPGGTPNVPDLDNYELTLIGHTLVAAAANAQNNPTIAYSTGSWPS